MSKNITTSKQTMILQGSLYRALLTLAIPIMLNNLIGTFYNLGDAFWVSRLGDVQVAAISFVWPVSFLTFSIAMGMSIAGGTIISQYLGAGRPEDAKATAQQLYVFGIIFGIFSSIIGWILTPSILHLMNASDALYANSVNYLRILFLEMPFLFMMNIFFSMNQSQGDTLTPTLVNGSSAILNILLDPLFIFTFGWGIEGAAIATVFSKIPFALYGVYKMSHGMKQVHIHPFNLKIHGEKMRDLIRIGIPSSLGNSGVALGFIFLFSFIATYGDQAVAALGIGNRLNGLAFMPAVGIGAALSTITGQNMGAKNIPRIKEAFKKSIQLALISLTFTSLILWFFSRQLVGIFSSSPEVIQMGSLYLRALASTTWSISFFNCSIGLFNGAGHTRYSMFLEAGRLWVIRMPLILLMTQIPSLGQDGAWYAIGLSNIIAATIAFSLTFLGTWQKPRLRSLAQ
jgi:putative MATE family efflux protein